MSTKRVALAYLRKQGYMPLNGLNYVEKTEKVDGVFEASVGLLVEGFEMFVVRGIEEDSKDDVLERAWEVWYTANPEVGDAVDEEGEA